MAVGKWFILQIVGLWISIVALACITSMAQIAASTRSDCDVIPASNGSIVEVVRDCTFREQISSTVYHHTSYFQSAHIIIIRAVATLSLIVLRPSLTAMVWSALESSANNGAQGLNMKMSALQSGVDVVNLPNFVPGLIYAWDSGSVSLRIAFVLVIGILSPLSPLAVSPIYRSHIGPFGVQASVNNGGGVGPNIARSLDIAGVVPGGIGRGRALLNAGTIMNATIYPTTPDITVAPFIPREAAQAIWSADIETAVARTSVDCGSTAPARISSQDIVTLNSAAFFSADRAPMYALPSFAGQQLGYLSTDAAVAAVYLNNSVSVVPGRITAVTSVVFLAINGTLEGAQQRITSPEPRSLVQFIDVLVCTSTTQLETSICTIDKGTVTGCAFSLPANGSIRGDAGGLGRFIANPLSVASYLAASPSTACYSLLTRLPMWAPVDEDIASNSLPLSYLTTSTSSLGYNIPLTYVLNAFFGQTAQGLVQGMVTSWSTYAGQYVEVTAIFGASKPALLYTILALSFICALTSTLASIIPRSARGTAPLSISRLLAISRSPRVTALLERYSNRHVRMEEEVFEAKVGYGWDEQLERNALLVETPHRPGLLSADTRYESWDSPKR